MIIKKGLFSDPDIWKIRKYGYSGEYEQDHLTRIEKQYTED